MDAEKLKQTVKDLPPLGGKSDNPFSWLYRQQEIRNRILNDDPARFLEWSVIMATMDTNPLFQLYHIKQWELVTGLSIASLDTIVEFGGGYGAMAKMLHERGFKGRYYSFDFPELVALQRFYLPDIEILTDIPKRCDLMIAICSLSEADIETRENFLNNLEFRHCLIRYQYYFYGINSHQYFERIEGQCWRDSGDLNHWYKVR